MADESGWKINKTHHREVHSLSFSSCPEKLRIHLLERNDPAVFDGAAKQWACSDWTPEFLAQELGDVRTNFRVCARQNLSVNGGACKKTIMETDCVFEKASFEEFNQWLNGCTERSGCLSRFQRENYWCYADYKYMAQLFKDFPRLRKSVDWSCFGFPMKSGDESTIWIGSAEASTPCHVDTYGCNLVAQIYGTKKWILFPPSETSNLYPTRIPYEESSVFSQVNITNPDLTRFPAFENALGYEVILKPGDVLFVPKKWWHYVESLETSISINTWIELAIMTLMVLEWKMFVLFGPFSDFSILDSDHLERVKEALVRTLVSALKEEEGAAKETWLNPSEEIGTHAQNMSYLNQALCAVKQGTSCGVDTSNLDGTLHRHMEENQTDVISTDDLINCITSPEVINAMMSKALKKIGIFQTINLPLESPGVVHQKLEPKQTVKKERNINCNSSSGSYELDESVRSEPFGLGFFESPTEQEISECPPLKRVCTDEERN